MKKGNKGMTLIELLVATAIASIILIIGYMIIDKTYTLSANQHRISDIQNGTNSIRNFLKDDLKASKSVFLEYTDGGRHVNVEAAKVADLNAERKILRSAIKKQSGYLKEYKFNIASGDKPDEVEQSYTVKIFDKNGERCFSISRKSKDNVNIEILSDQKISTKGLPLDIKIKSKQNMYSVGLNYAIKNQNKLFTFDVYNERLNADFENVVEEFTERKVNSLLKAYLDQSALFIKQASLENRRNHFTNEFNNIMDSIGETREDDTNIKSEAEGLINDINELWKNWGDKENKEEVKFYLNQAVIYLEKIVYVVENQNFDTPPNMDRNFVNTIGLDASISSNHVDLKSIWIKLSSDTKDTNLGKLEKYLDIHESDYYTYSLKTSIDKLKYYIDLTDTRLKYIVDYPYYAEDYKTDSARNIDTLIKDLNNIKSKDINKFRSVNEGEYIYLNNSVNNDQRERQCALNLIDALEQNINVAIEELQYLKFMIGK